MCRLTCLSAPWLNYRPYSLAPKNCSSTQRIPDLYHVTILSQFHLFTKPRYFFLRDHIKSIIFKFSKWMLFKWFFTTKLCSHEIFLPVLSSCLAYCNRRYVTILTKSSELHKSESHMIALRSKHFCELVFQNSYNLYMARVG